MTPTDHTPLLLDRRQAARALAICTRSLDALARRGELPAVHIGRAVRYDVADLQAYINKQKTPGKPAMDGGNHDARSI